MKLRGTLWSCSLALAGLSVMGCGGKKSKPPEAPAPVAEKPTPPPPPPPVCVPAYEPALVTSATADADTTAFCVSDGGEQSACFEVDLNAGKYKKVDEAPAAQSATLEKSPARVETTATEVKVCTGEGDDTCKTFKPKVAKGASEPLRAVIDATGTTAVVLLGDAEAGKGVAEVWDVAKGKKGATIKYAKGDHKCGDAQILGDVVYISASVCAGPAAKGGLYSFKGKKLADVGGKDFGTYGTSGVQVDATQWAFLEEGAGAIAIQDLKTGKVAKTIDLVGLWGEAGSGDGEAAPAGGNPGESSLVRGGEGKLIVITGSPTAGSVGVVDIASGETKVVRALACKGDDAPAAAGDDAPAGEE